MGNRKTVTHDADGAGFYARHFDRVLRVTTGDGASSDRLALDVWGPDGYIQFAINDVEELRALRTAVEIAFTDAVAK